MKHLMKHLSCLLVVLLASVALASCGDDDDDDDDDPGKTSSQSALVGTWEITDDDGDYWETDRITLNSDGTGLGIEHYATSDPDLDPDSYTFRWAYSESTKILTIIEDAYLDDDADTYFYYVSEINSTYAVLYDYEDGKVDYSDPWVLKRVK
jgi:hypothetical protein